MARIIKAKSAKLKPKKAAKAQAMATPAAKTASSTDAKSKHLKLVHSQNENAKADKTAKAKGKDVAAPEKKVSSKLIETIERRKAEQQGKKGGQMFGRPAGRRGRRPKAAAEYTPTNSDEEAYVLESDYEGLEYDTGISVKTPKDDGAFNLERFEDFEEELNFDW